MFYYKAFIGQIEHLEHDVTSSKEIATSLISKIDNLSGNSDPIKVEVNDVDNKFRDLKTRLYSKRDHLISIHGVLVKFSSITSNCKDWSVKATGTLNSMPACENDVEESKKQIRQIEVISYFHNTLIQLLS